MDVERLRDTVLTRYSSKDDVGIYANRATEGLRNWEKLIVKGYMLPSKVLSIGCGGGRESFALETLGYDVHGLDISKQQIDSANAKKRELGSKARFLSYDGLNIPFPDMYFGSITMWSQVLGNVPGSKCRLHLMSECFRVLKAEGTFSVSVHDRERTMRLVRDSEGEYQELSSGELGDILYKVASGLSCYWHYFTKEEIRQLCIDAGFSLLLLSTSDQMGQDWDNLNIVVCRKEGAAPAK